MKRISRGGDEKYFRDIMFPSLIEGIYCIEKKKTIEWGNHGDTEGT